MDKRQSSNKNKNDQNNKPENGLFGVDLENSLQSVSFATTENPYLNEGFRDKG